MTLPVQKTEIVLDVKILVLIVNLFKLKLVGEFHRIFIYYFILLFFFSSIFVLASIKLVILADFNIDEVDFDNQA